ncbi:hypothetical protein [Streptomyces sp. NPDC093970]|uniref:hypothetical protein n=1 Tax=Streptomyces sp. NPDC093970 TaxID=3155076 RepID=UPI00343A3EC8
MPRDDDQAVAVALAALLLAGTAIRVGPLATFTVTAGPVVTAHAAPRLARRITVRELPSTLPGA